MMRSLLNLHLADKTRVHHTRGAVWRRCKALVLALFIVVALASFGRPAWAQETQSQETAALDRVGPLKLINTAIFLALLGWFIARKAPAFFNARSADIQKAIKDATGLKLDADFRYSEIDRKMASLGEEVNRMREQAKIEMAREHERFQQQTEVERERIRQNADVEIEALRKEASDRVQSRTAQLALGLAERRLQDRIARGEAGNVVDDFVRLVERGKN